MLTINPGEVIADKYRVERLLGVGGMGMVVAATHLVLGHQVALKLMLPDGRNERFMREARIMMQLKSAHVCRVIDVGTYRERPFMVMELLEGRDLAQELAARRILPLIELVDTLLQALEALAEAHSLGIVHRDLKPANLFVTHRRDIKLLDFGISKIEGNATRTSEMLGTPAYMAPEQIESSRDVDQRADIWAIGVIAYQAITGSLPFYADSVGRTVLSVLNDEVPLIHNVPLAFAHVIARCLAKKKEQRFANVGELAAALAPFGSQASVTLSEQIVRIRRPSQITMQGMVTAAPSTSRLGMFALLAMIGAGVAVGATTKMLAKHRDEVSPEVAMTVVKPTIVEKIVEPAPVPAVVEVRPVVAKVVVKAKITAKPSAAKPYVVPVVAKPSPAIVAPPVVATPVPPPIVPPAANEPLALELGAGQIGNVFDRLRAQITERCGVDDNHGRVTLHLTVAPSGEIASIDASPPELPLAHCLIEQLRGVMFPATLRGASFLKTYAF